MPPRTAFLAVSLFKPELQGEMLERHLSLINDDYRFSSVVIALGDTLHQHNLTFKGIYHDERIGLAIRYGDEWLQLAKPKLDAMHKPHVVLRFDKQKSLSDYDRIRAGLDRLFEREPFSSALTADIGEFIERTAPAYRSARTSRDFILEELSADIGFSRLLPYSHIYPGKLLRSYLAMIENVDAVPRELRGLENCAFFRTRADRRKGKVWFAGEPIMPIEPVLVSG